MDSVLEESEKDFNQTIFYGKDTSVDNILDASKRYPVMASVQLIVVKEAQHLSRNLNQFEKYFKKPIPTTILVFCSIIYVPSNAFYHLPYGKFLLLKSQILKDLLIKKFLNLNFFVILSSSSPFHVIRKLESTKKESMEINPKIFP